MENDKNLLDVFDDNEKITQNEYKKLKELARNGEKLLKELKKEDLEKLKKTLKDQLNNYSFRNNVNDYSKKWIEHLINKAIYWINKILSEKESSNGAIKEIFKNSVKEEKQIENQQEKQVNKNGNVDKNKLYKEFKNFVWQDNIDIFKKHRDIDTVINNFKVLNDNWINFTPQNLFDLSIKNIDNNDIEYIKNIWLNKLNVLDLYELSKRWIKFSKYKELMDGSPEIAKIFDNTDIPIHFVLELIRQGFPIKELQKAWYSDDIIKQTLTWKIEWYKDWEQYNIYHLIILFNRSKYKKYINWKEVPLNNLTFKEIFDVCQKWISWWENFYIYVEILKKKWKLQDYINWESNDIVKFNDEIEKKIYIEKLWNIKHLDWLIDNEISIEEAKKILNYTKNIWISFNWKDIAYISLNDISLTQLWNLLKINPNFSWEDIAYILWNNIDLDKVKDFVKINPNISGIDIVNLINYKIPLEFYKQNYKLSMNEIVNNFLIQNFEIDENKRKKIQEIFDNLEWVWSLTCKRLVEKNIFLEDILKFKSNIPKDYNFSDEQIITLLESWVDIKEIHKFKQLKKEEIETILKKDGRYWLDENNIEWEYNELIVNLLKRWISFNNFMKINNTEWVIWKISYDNLINIMDLWIKPEELNTFLLQIEPYLKNSWYDNYAFNVLVKELIWNKNFKEVFYFLENNKNLKLNIWNKKIKLYWNIQLLNWLLIHINRNLNWDITDIWNSIKSYEDSLNKYINVKNNVDKVIFLWWNTYYWEDHNNFISGNKTILEKQYPWKVNDYTTWTELSKKILWPDDFIDILEKELENNKNKNILLYLWVHWSVSWSWWFLEKKHFEKIRDLAANNPNLKVVINSCNSLYKFDDNWNNKLDKNELKWNIIINSLWNYATTIYSDLINKSYLKNINWKLNWDFNDDWLVSIWEAELYTKINYNDSFILESFYKNENWKNNIIDDKNWSIH